MAGLLGLPALMEALAALGQRYDQARGLLGGQTLAQLSDPARRVDDSSWVGASQSVMPEVRDAAQQRALLAAMNVGGLLGITGRELTKQVATKYPDVSLTISGGENGAPLTVSKIIVDKSARGQGVGSAAMQDILAAADRDGQVVALSPSGDFGGSKARLIDWYRSMGFIPNRGRYADHSISESMFRPPEP